MLPNEVETISQNNINALDVGPKYIFEEEDSLLLPPETFNEVTQMRPEENTNQKEIVQDDDNANKAIQPEINSYENQK